MPHSWDNFFILAGGAAATLMGLLFVAVTVGGTGFSTAPIVHGARGFLTPALVHFGTVLLQALAVLVPWSSSWPIGIIFCLGGLTGLAYQIIVVVQQRKVGPVWLDWLDRLPYVYVPALACATLIVGSVGLITEKSFAPYAIAGATTLFLVAGVYGAWDVTLWIIKNRDKTQRRDDSI